MIPEYQDVLYSIYREDSGYKLGHEMNFPKTALTSTTKIAIIENQRYDIFVSTQGHEYIVVNYRRIDD